MKILLVDISPRHQTLLRQLRWAVLIILVLASLPSLFNLANRGIEWITGLFPSFHGPWEAPLWFL
jgi:hypothetical protein